MIVAQVVRVLRQYPAGRLVAFVYIISLHLFIYVLLHRCVLRVGRRAGGQTQCVWCGKGRFVFVLKLITCGGTSRHPHRVLLLLCVAACHWPPPQAAAQGVPLGGAGGGGCGAPRRPHLRQRGGLAVHPGWMMRVLARFHRM